MDAVLNVLADVSPTPLGRSATWLVIPCVCLTVTAVATLVVVLVLRRRR